jgi:hypothetical protein
MGIVEARSASKQCQLFNVSVPVLALSQVNPPLIQPTMDQSPIPSKEYNSLPYVRKAHERSESTAHEAARVQLLQLIHDHNLDHMFSVHLLHKHSDAPEGKVMVYELVCGSDHPTFRVLVPRDPRKDKDADSILNPKYFFATAAGTMRAYEYSKEPMPDIAKHHWFLPIFARKLLDLKVQDTFSLGVIPLVQLTGATEIELSNFHATVFVKDLEITNPSAVTDWFNPAAAVDTEGLPINQARDWRTGRCIYSYWYHSAAGYEAVDGGEPKLCVNGVPLPKDTPAYSIITNAIDYIAVA